MDRTSLRALLFRPKVALVALLMLQVALPLIMKQPSVGYDGRQYLAYAENLLKQHRFTYDGALPSSGRAPGYPAFLAIFLAVFGDIDLVYPIQLAMLFAAYVIVAWPLRAVLPRWWRVGLVAFLVGCWPLHGLGTSIQSEALFILLISAGLLFLTRFLARKTPMDLVLFSTALTLSAYVRPVSMLFVIFAAALLLIARRIGFRHALAMSLISIALLAPWTYRNWHVFGRFIPLASGYGSIYYMTDQRAFTAIMLGAASASHELSDYREIVGNDFELDLAANDRYLARATQNIADDPLGFIKRCVLKTLFVWSYLPATKVWLKQYPVWFFGGMIVQLAFLGSAIWGARRLHRRFSWLVWPTALFAAYHLLVLFPFYAESRFLVPVYILLAGFSTYAVFECIERIRHRLSSRHAGMRS